MEENERFIVKDGTDDGQYVDIAYVNGEISLTVKNFVTDDQKMVTLTIRQLRYLGDAVIKIYDKIDPIFRKAYS